MRKLIPNSVYQIIRSMNRAGWEVYIVGGAVRDMLMGKEVDDWDFATNAAPPEVQKIFPHGYYDNQFGTVGIPIQKGNTSNTSVEEKDKYDVYEVTTFRTETGYSDKRRPDSVKWGKSLAEDLARRDFTINAMALKAKSNTGNTSSTSNTGSAEVEVEVIDPFGGQKDLENKIIRAVGNPNERFQEDALRMMRAIRLGAQLSFTIEFATLAAIKENHQLISHVSWERIRDELLKIIGSLYPADGVTILQMTGILELILPELTTGVGIPQGGHHIHDVFTHAVESLRHCPSPDAIVRLSTLLHDVGKPDSLVERDGKPTFYNHEVIGARLAKKIADRLRLSSNQRDFLWKMVRWHMFAYDPGMTDAAIRRFMRRVGREDVPKMMALRVGDRKGGGSKETSWRLEELKRRIEELMHDPLNVTDLKINGHDVIRILGIKPGPRVGEILNTLFEEVIEDPRKNERDYLLQRVQEVLLSI